MLSCSVQARNSDSKHSVTCEDQMAFAHQIAQGMAHLESKGVVHGHLATYVVLLYVIACLQSMWGWFNRVGDV
jgi:hypothetical protein